MESDEHPGLHTIPQLTTETEENVSKKQLHLHTSRCTALESSCWKIQTLENEGRTNSPTEKMLHNSVAEDPVPETLQKIVSKRKELLCKFCLKVFSVKGNRSRHEKNCKSKSSTSNRIKCSNCHLPFTRKDSLKKHLIKCLARTNEPNISPQLEESNQLESQNASKVVFYCDGCNSSFNRKFNFLRHQKICTNHSKKKHCLVEKCHSTFFHKNSLIHHLKTQHKEEVHVKDPISKKFSSFDEFISWKESEEEGCYSYFSKQCGKTNNKEYYYCQHDGSAKHHESKKTSRSNIKGRVKAGHHCIAKMKVWREKTHVYVEYHPTHSHRCNPKDLVHHPLPHDVSEFINKQLAEDVSPKKIYRKVKQIHIQRNANNVQSLRVNTLTKKLVRERARKLRKAQRMHTDDAKAVFLLAKANEESIIIYKPYNEQIEKGPKEVDSLPNSTELFMLGIQTDRQKDLMQEHCGKILIVDATHGTNHYKFHLLTCMIVDHNHRGWPVAHLITSKCDSATLKFFFEAIRENVGTETENMCVITDDDPALINALKQGFDCQLRHLLCYWHLLKSLKENLRTKASKGLFETMMEELKVIVSVKDESQFVRLTQGFLKKYEENDEAKSFIAYFKTYYLSETRVEKWAHCYRNFPHGGINTTGHLESFHNKLKQEYLNRKVNKRLDDLVNILFEMEWEDHCRRAREASVGFLSQPHEIFKRHKEGVALEDNSLNQILENIWEIKSGSSENVYTVSKFSSACPADICFCTCGNPGCPNLCYHMYSCSCPDRHPLCKHIHRLHSYLTRHEPPVNQVEDNFYELPQPSQGLYCEAQTSSNLHERRFKSLKSKIKASLSVLSEFETSASLSETTIHSLAHVESTLSNLVQCLEQTKVNEENLQKVPLMTAAQTFHSQEKLKTQLSQIASFKKPKGKRKRNEPSLSTENKKRVMKNLIDYLPETSSDDIEQL